MTRQLPYNIGDRFITLREIVYSDRLHRFDSKVFPIGSIVTYKGGHVKRDLWNIIEYHKFQFDGDKCECRIISFDVLKKLD